MADGDDGREVLHGGGVMRFNMSLVILATLLVTPLPAAGQLVEGAKVRVAISGTLADDGSVTPGRESRSIVGRFVAMEASHLVLAVGDDAKSVRVPKAMVNGLEVRRRSRLTGALIGAGIGALVGAVWGWAEASQCQSRTGPANMCGLDAIAPMVVALPAGTLAGVVIGMPRWVRVSPAVFALRVAPAARGARIGGAVRF